jgi:hypothetical protein
MLRMRIFAIDTLAMELSNNAMVEYWSQTFVNTSAINVIPSIYSASSTAIFLGLNSITINGALSQFMNIKYETNTFSVPSTYKATFDYFFISSASCHSGSVGNTGLHKCYNGYNGCPFTTNQAVTINKLTTSFKISKTNKYMLFATS